MKRARATLNYPPDYDGQLFIDLTRVEQTDTFDYVEIKLRVASRKAETLADVIRRVGREMMCQPLTVGHEVEVKDEPHSY